MSQSPPSSSEKEKKKNDGDWRASVAQSTRSAEVRVVADMLAKMEHAATSSSKLMLAMRFEDEIFNKATSLADYQKRIQKRLKKFAKNFKATAPSPVPTGSQQERLLELKRKYGERLAFIVNNADKAISIILKKNEPEKAKGLKQHTDNAQVWATNLGVMEGTSLNTGMTPQGIDEMQSLLERRVDNIRHHVMKLADMNLFLQETLEKLDHDLNESASNLLAAATSRRLSKLKWSDFKDPLKALQEYLDKTQATIPPPTRNKNSQTQAALAHLERMRAASQAVLAFLAISNKESSALPRNVLKKCQAAAMTTLDFIAQVMPELVNEHATTLSSSENKQEQVTLQDAWTQVMEYPSPEHLVTDRAAKRAKTTNQVVFSSRVLLTPGRKIPSNLSKEITRKGARLVQTLQDSHLVMEFGNAFCMTIYMVPLLVTIRAMTTTSTSDDDDDTSSLDGCTTTWTPVQAGLEEYSFLDIWGVSGTAATLGHVVQGQLDYASAQATAVLRKFFSFATKNAKSDFEVEISEGTALLQFLQLARTTYTPNFKEKE